MTDLSVETTAIPGLLIIRLPVHGDNRGWFKESWQRAKMTALGVPDFGPVQNNVSFNDDVGVTRGIHAEPWDKFVSLAHGRIFGAWVDLRAGETFGTLATIEMGPETAVFVPRGVGNSYQTLEPGTAYSYLVNKHWSEAARSSYTMVNLADPTLDVPWPIPLEESERSEADKGHPLLSEVTPFRAAPVLVLGAGGQLGTALRQAFPEATAVDLDVVDFTDLSTFDAVSWGDYDVVINAAAFTAVDVAETPAGRALAWQINVAGVSKLVALGHEHGFTLVHVSSEYVFDGTREEHLEDEGFAPLGVYAQTKAAGDAIVATLPRHYLLRTSWVIGEGKNFVRTMAELAERGISPAVVDDQHGRLTFAADLAAAIKHLLDVGADFGTYNISSDGPVQTWAEIARAVYAARGRDAADVASCTTEQYAEGKELSPRPQHSALNLEKIKATGFKPVDGPTALAEYLSDLS